MPDPIGIDTGKTFTALVRIHEANCHIDFPSEVEQNFRVAVMKKLGLELGLPEVRSLTIAGASKGVPRPGQR